MPTQSPPSLISHPVLTPAFLRGKFDAGKAHDEYVASATPEDAKRWREMYEQLALTDDQKTLVGSFERQMHVLVTSGTWCGDCVAQCPMMARIAEANPDKITLRFVDRDEHADLSEKIIINMGMRVPTVVFMAEDFEPIAIFGDRTLTRYRHVAKMQLGDACPTLGAPVPEDHLAATLEEWVDQFERAALLLRVSARLREQHGD